MLVLLNSCPLGSVGILFFSASVGKLKLLSSNCLYSCVGKRCLGFRRICPIVTDSIPISFCLQSILLSDESSEADSQSEDNEEEEEEEELHLSREELHNMLRLHKYKKLHQNKYSKDKEVREFQWKSQTFVPCT